MCPGVRRRDGASLRGGFVAVGSAGHFYLYKCTKYPVKSTKYRALASGNHRQHARAHDAVCRIAAMEIMHMPGSRQDQNGGALGWE